MNDVTNKAICLKLNSAWQPVGYGVVKDAIIDLVGGESVEALDIQYSLNDDGTPNFNEQPILNPVGWDEWMNLPIRSWDLVVHSPKLTIRAPTIVIARNYNRMPIKMWKGKPSKEAIFIRDGGKCFSGDSFVKTSQYEFKEIQNINIGDTVMSHVGTFEKVTHVFKSKHNSDLISFKPMGCLPIKCTSNHPFFTIPNEKIEKYSKVSKLLLNSISKNDINIVDADKLKNGNFILIPLPTTQFPIDIQYIDLWEDVYSNRRGCKLTNDKQFIKDYHNVVINRFIQIDDELSYIFGLYLSEGSVYDGRISFAFHKKETEYYFKIKNFFLKYNIETCMEIENNSMHVRVSSVWMSEILIKYFGKLAENKYINPIIISKFSKTNILNLIRGECDGDSCKYIMNIKNTSNKTSLWTISKHLAYQIQSLCYLIDIYPNLSCINRKNRKFNQYIINFQGEDNIKLYDLCDVKYKTSNKKYFINIDGMKYIVTRISKISTCKFDDYVYNLEVENNHSYTVNTISTHNCQYTGKKLDRKEMSVDHVLPTSRGGGNDWTNLVSTSKELNSKKGNSLNSEIGLTLLRQPMTPRPMPISQLLREVRHPDWRIFIKP